VNREQKLSLIIGFTLILLVGVLISDHLSGARTATISGVERDEAGLFDTELVSTESPVAPFHIGSPSGKRAEPGADADRPSGQSIAKGDPPAQQSERSAPFSIDQSSPNSGLLAEIAGRAGTGTSGVLDLPIQKAPLVRTEPQVGPKVEPSPEPPVRWHTVAEGESLWSIAERYYASGAYWQRLAEHNADRIGSAGTIRAGIRIQIPELEGVRTRAGASAPLTPPKVAEHPVATRTYTVRKGDTIGEIAQELLGSARRWPEIVKANADTITDENVLLEGQVLKIPAR